MKKPGSVESASAFAKSSALGNARTSADYSAEYQSRADDDLLQLWVERSELQPEAEEALRSEISRRRLTDQAATAKDRRIEEDSDSRERNKSDHRLAAPVTAWGTTIAWYWLRELRLRYRTRNGIAVPARVESTLLTRPLPGRGGGGRRSELRYSYEYEGAHTGRTVRDFIVGDGTGKALAFEHKAGDTITVLVDPNNPDCSYFSSGFGWLQPFFYGAFFSLLALFLLIGAVVGIFNLNWHR